MKEEKESKMISALKGMASTFGFTPRSLADSFDSLINKQLALIAREEMKKKPRFFNCYFEMAENVNNPEKAPIVTVFGIAKTEELKSVRIQIREINFQSEVFDKVLDDNSLGMVRMATTMFDFDTKEMMVSFYDKINKALHNEMIIKGHPVKVVVFIGGKENGGKLKANLSSMSNKFYKRNFEFSSLIPENETF